MLARPFAGPLLLPNLGLLMPDNWRQMAKLLQPQSLYQWGSVDNI